MYENHGLNVIFCRHNCFCISCLHQARENSYKICVRRVCVCVCVLFICVPVAFFTACHFPVDDVVESKAMMIDVPTVCSMECFKRCGVCFLNLDASYQNNKKRFKRKASHIFTIFPRNRKSSPFVTDLLPVAD